MSTTTPTNPFSSALTGEPSPALVSPTRNRYFYGKLLDARHLRLEQEYFLDRSRQINRMGLGFGVLCGLRLELAADDTKIIVHPGVAIDGFGREIVVAAPVYVDPAALEGNDGGIDNAQAGFTVCLCYHECETEPAPALVSECDVRERCVNGLIRERFRIHLHRGIPAAPPYVGATGLLGILLHRLALLERELAGVAGVQAPAGPAAPPSLDEISALHLAGVAGLGQQTRGPLRPADVLADPTLVELISCSAPRDDCVVLGTVIPGSVTPPADGPTAPELDGFTYRRTIMSNDALFELILGLTMLVERCCRSLKPTNTVTVTGDAQTAKAGSRLAEPIVVEVRGPDNEPVADQPVSFRVTSTSGGSFDPAQPNTDADGRASSWWTLGDARPQTGLVTAGDQNAVLTATIE